MKDFKMRGYLFNNKLTVKKVLSQSEWAAHLGSTRESVSRAFNRLERLAIISIKSGSLTLENDELLFQFIQSKRSSAADSSRF
jgi:CRP-like cAMP-binding protein